MTQARLSASIKEPEDVIEVALIYRSKRRVVLTGRNRNGGTRARRGRLLRGVLERVKGNCVPTRQTLKVLAYLLALDCRL